MVYDVVVIGAGAAGLMCAAQAGYAGRRVLVVDHANKAGKKILMSGGGRCNFTNLDTAPGHFYSENPYFCISALKPSVSHFMPFSFNISIVKSFGNPKVSYSLKISSPGM